MKKPLTGTVVHKIMQRDTLDKLMLGYVLAVRRVSPDTTLRQAIEMFSDEFGLLDADEFNVQTAMRNMQESFVQLKNQKLEL